MLEYSTGNETVDAMASIQFTGNVIPQIWYKQIVRDNGKPHLLAISILADIVYWYRPTEIREPGTGSFLGFRKKFKGDLLQRSYQQFADMFGESKRTVTEAVVRLESLGVVKRIFRTIDVGGMLYNNVLFIQLNPDKLYDITYPSISVNDESINKESLPIACDENKQSQTVKDIDNGANHDTESCDMDTHIFSKLPERPLSQNNVIGGTQKCDRGHIKKGEGSQNFVTRNTKNTTENITENKSSSSKKGQGNSPPPDDDDGLLKEVLNYNQVIKTCPSVLVESVFKEIKSLDKGLLVQIDAELFMRICENINAFSADISNSSAYIRTCINNLIVAKKVSENCNHKPKMNMKNRFNQFQQRDDYDFEVLERELVQN